MPNSPIVPAAILAAILLAAPARAEVRMPDKSPLPKTLNLILEDNGDPKTVWIASEPCEARELPAPAGPDNPVTSASKSIKFLTVRYLVVDPNSIGRKGIEPGPWKHQIGTKSYYLVARANPRDQTTALEVTGWIDGNLLLMGREARIDPTTDIYQKAMVVNSPRSLKRDVARAKIDKKILEAVEVRLAPDPLAKPLPDTPRVFTLFFVYSETQNFVLIGSRYAFEGAGDSVESSAAARKVLLGWLPKDRVAIWNTREAMDWDGETTRVDAKPRRTNRGATYETQEQAHLALKGKSSDAQDVAQVHVEEFDENGVTIPLPYDMMHYPVFETPISPKALALDIQNNNLRYIGGVGSFEGIDGKRLTNLEILDYQHKIDEAASQLARTEILFVVDDTSSMIDWFPVAAQTFKGITDRFGGANVHASICYYNDGVGPEAGFEVHPLQELRLHLADLTKEINLHAPKDGGDGPERVFRGIGRALKFVGFNDPTNNSRKLVVVLGDDCDKLEAGDTTAEDVAALLVPPQGTPVEFYAIQVADPSDADKRAFRDQMGELVTLARAKYRERYGAGDKDEGRYVFRPKRERDTIVKGIIERYDQLRAERDAWLGVLGQNRQGQFNSRGGAQLEKILKELGVDIETLKSMKGVQIFDQGYLWEKNSLGLRQIRPYLLINESELDQVLRLLQALTKPTDGSTRIDELVETAVKAMVGQLPTALRPGDNRNLSLSDLIKLINGLEFDSDFLKQTAQSLGKLNGAGPSRKQLARIALCRMRLEDAKQGVRYEYTSQTYDVGGGFMVERWQRKGNPIPNPRAHFIGGDESAKWYWIDHREEWP